MKLIKLTKGYFTKVDDDDYERFNKYKWYAGLSNHLPRARRWIQNKKYKKLFYLSREIMNAPKGINVDHVNGDTLDNRKCNLRFCTNQQNLENRSKNKRNISGYKGVVPGSISHPNKWRAQIGTRRNRKSKTYNLGHYDTKEEAARAYDKKAKELFGDFARLNFSD